MIFCRESVSALLLATVLCALFGLPNEAKSAGSLALRIYCASSLLCGTKLRSITGRQHSRSDHIDSAEKEQIGAGSEHQAQKNESVSKPEQRKNNKACFNAILILEG